MFTTAVPSERSPPHMHPTSSNDASSRDAELADRIATLKNFHQFYRDSLSQPGKFPDIGTFPPDLIKWVTDRRNIDVPQLVEIIDSLPPSGLSPEHDLALRMAMFTILQANLASDYNNTYPNHTLPPDVIVNIKRSLGRILELHPTGDYIALCVQLLYRIKEIEEVLVLEESYPDMFARYPALQAIAGFIHAMLGNHGHALSWLEPLAHDPQNRNLPMVGLSVMTCQYFTGRTPEWPLSFSSLQDDPQALQGLIGQLPAIEMVEPLAATPRPVAFVACDTHYFMKHARYLACSLHATNAGKLDLHLHVYAPTPQVFAELAMLRQNLPGLAIGLSIEQGPMPAYRPASYFATVRFLRAYQVLRHYRCELCLMDADALFNGDWDVFARSLPADAELVLARSEASPFWERIVAGFAYCRPTALAERFLARVAHFIVHNIAQNKLVWFTDQVALSVCDDQEMRDNPANPSIHRIDYRTVIDLQHTPDSLCWMVTTKKTGNADYDDARARLARRYTIG